MPAQTAWNLNAIIGRMHDDGKVNGVYVWYNGTVGGVGKMLVQHYDSTEKIDALLANGNIVLLAPSIGEKYDSEKDTSMFAGRDRGSKDCDAVLHDNIADFLSFGIDKECTSAYVFEQREWIVYPGCHRYEPVLEALQRLGYMDDGALDD